MNNPGKKPPFDFPGPKSHPTQELLGAIYDDLDIAVDLIEAVYQASCGPDHDHETTNPLRAVLTVAKDRAVAAQKRLHTTIAWASPEEPRA